MVTGTPNTPVPGDVELLPIRKSVIDAIAVMSSRAIEPAPGAPDRSPDNPVVEDAKDEVKENKLPSSGPLQDCEFGMALLLACEWLNEPFYAGVKRDVFERVVIALVNRTVRRVLLRNQSDKGGGGNHAAFFTGEPYTEYNRGRFFSANLDAAMITLAFLAPATLQLNDLLVKHEHGIDPGDVTLPEWVKNLRDAALYVILEGLEYARQCVVLHNGSFYGFTCDPESNAESPRDGGLERDEDRLFFTWTACETINDMLQWRRSYAGPLGEESLVPAVSQLDPLIKELEGLLRQAAQWCQDTFLERFESFEPRDTKDLVKEIGTLRVGAALTPEQQSRVDTMAASVQHVYHLSQYAAIRSLVPKSMSFKEVRTVIDKLDLLVSRSILGSRLDEAEHPVLFLTLTRAYSLGRANPEPYKDDAWYPLVVRSLAGLLSRTLDDIGKNFSRPEVLGLTLTFQRSLENHVKNMLDRRPAGGEEGSDGKLWSFASDQPYVLYATQRTVFALMKYEDFLLAVDAFQKEEPDDEKREEEIAMIFARRFADFFRPTIKELVSLVPTTTRAGRDGQPALPAGDLPLPEEPWAAAVIRNWLAAFTEDFKRAQVAANLSQRTSELVRIRKYVENYQPSPALKGPENERKRKNVESQLDVLKREYQSICGCDGAGPKLSVLQDWEDGELTPILFEYLFNKYLEQPTGSFEDLLDKQQLHPELWKLIQKAKGTQENISNLDPTATI